MHFLAGVGGLGTGTPNPPLTKENMLDLAKIDTPAAAETGCEIELDYNGSPSGWASVRNWPRKPAGPGIGEKVLPSIDYRLASLTSPPGPVMLHIS